MRGLSGLIPFVCAAVTSFLYLLGMVLMVFATGISVSERVCVSLFWHAFAHFVYFCTLLGCGIIFLPCECRGTVSEKKKFRDA